MFKRYLNFSYLFLLLGAPLGSLVVFSDDQGIWLCLFAIYGVVGGIGGVIYVLFGGKTSN